MCQASGTKPVTYKSAKAWLATYRVVWGEYNRISLPESLPHLRPHLLWNPQPTDQLEVLSSLASLNWLSSGQGVPACACAWAGLFFQKLHSLGAEQDKEKKSPACPWLHFQRNPHWLWQGGLGGHWGNRSCKFSKNTVQSQSTYWEPLLWQIVIHS